MKIIEYTTPNMSSRQGWVPDMICCHQTAGAASAAKNWFTNKESKVSAHFLVDKAGNVFNFVPIEKAAWANGTNTTDSGLPYHYSKSTSKTVRERRTNANFYTVSVEFENDDTGRLTDAQFEAGLALMKYIRGELKRIYDLDFTADREHIIGHCELNPTQRSGCPGRDFPYEKFIDGLRKDSYNVETESMRSPLYCVQTGLYRNLSTAADMVEKLRQAGFAAYITDMFENI